MSAARLSFFASLLASIAIASCVPAPAGHAPVAASTVPPTPSASIESADASTSADRFVLILDSTMLYAKPSHDAAIAVTPPPHYVLPVTVRRLDFAFPNGTRVSLLPGLALGPVVEGAPAGTERRSVRNGGYQFFVDVPPDAVGTSYGVAPPFRVAPRDTSMHWSSVRPTVDLLFGEAVRRARFLDRDAV